MMPKRPRGQQWPDLLMAWAYSLSFPLGVAGLLYFRWGSVHHGWVLHRWFGLEIMSIGLILLPFHIMIIGMPLALKRQAIYSDILTAFLRGWILFSRTLGNFGLVFLIALACVLWPLSHRQLLILKNASATE